MVTLIEVLPDGHGGWKVVGHTQQQARPKEVFVAARLRLKRDAVRFGRGMANGVLLAQQSYAFELQIKDRKGRIRQKDTYGHDPRRTRG